jgi:thiamine-phosphate pyrophosphorylase
LTLYYITDRKQFPGDEAERRHRLLEKIGEAAHAGIDYIQLREKDLSSRELESLAQSAVTSVQGTRTRLLINSRSDIAIACGANGVHLTSNDISAGDARSLWMNSRPQRSPLIAVSSHSAAEVRMAESQGSDFAVLAPIFGKGDGVGIGLSVLAEACGQVRSPEHTESAPNPSRFPILALGGVTLTNARACLAAGAAGVAGIRIFQENDVAQIVRSLQGLRVTSALP